MNIFFYNIPEKLKKIQTPAPTPNPVLAHWIAGAGAGARVGKNGRGWPAPGPRSVYSLDEVFKHIIIIKIRRRNKENFCSNYRRVAENTIYFCTCTPVNIDCITFIFTPVCSAVNCSLDEVFIHIIITKITQIQTRKERENFFSGN